MDSIIVFHIIHRVFHRIVQNNCEEPTASRAKTGGIGGKYEAVTPKRRKWQSATNISRPPGLKSYPAALPPGRGVSGFAGNFPYAKERPWTALAPDTVTERK
ncbi:MAG: hypothetical protein IJ350_06690, partial [Clostridia bacterium]|nr:hypothetical protein [Clostridia bacterium]